MKHKHSDDDIIIKDQDGSYKILVNGVFVPLSDVKGHDKDAKAAPKEGSKDEPRVKSTQKQASTVQRPAKNKAQFSGFGDKDLTAKAEALLSKVKITFASGELRGRAVNALIAQLKGVRKPFETKQTLTKPVADGGVGLGEQQAEALMVAMGAGSKQRAPQAALPVAAKPMQPPAQQARPAPAKPPVQQAKPVPVQPPAQQARPAPVQQPKPKPVNPVVKPMKPEKVVGKEVSAPPKVELEKLPPPPPAASVPVPPTEHARVPKPVVADVKMPVLAAVGPVQELSYSLVDWRRLGVNPLDRVKKIENQLGVLEQERYADRLAGMAAWRNSEVIKLYLEAGQKSLESGQGLQDHLGAGGPTDISYDEWQAISDLESRLRG